MKLLIADDEDMIRNGIAKYVQLHTDRFDRILLARDGREALEMLRRYRPEVMLLDIQMPGMTGLEVMEEAQGEGALPATVILSGYEDFQYAQQAFRLGARDYIVKPSRSSDILARLIAIADALQGRRAESIDQGQDRNKLVENARRVVDNDFHKNITLVSTASRIGISPGYLSTVFKQQTGISFVGYLNKVRIEHACTYLLQNYLKTYEIAYKVGFRDEKYFSKVFRKQMGMTPSEYRKTHGTGK